MQPLYLARIEDLGRGDLVQINCAACHHVALLTRNSCYGSGSALRPRCSISKGGSDVADAEREDELSFGQMGASALTQRDGTGRRSSLARIASADLVQTNGLGLALCSAR